MAALLYAVSLSPFGRGLLQEAAPAIRQKISSFGMDRHFLLYACLMSTLHAGLEEYYWRWFVYGSLARWRGSALIWHAVAAFAFASHHVVVLASYFSLTISLLFGLGVAGAGMVWSLLYRASGSLLGSFLSHLLADAAIMAVAWRVLQG
jgi:membrane protease YdiL (CAAX protease family)